VNFYMKNILKVVKRSKTYGTVHTKLQKPF
jgi:hypothetical protein